MISTGLQRNFDSLTAMEAKEREIAAPNIGRDDTVGAHARLVPIVHSVRHWFEAEARRCGTDIVVSTAGELAAQILAMSAALLADDVGNHCTPGHALDLLLPAVDSAARRQLGGPGVTRRVEGPR